MLGQLVKDFIVGLVILGIGYMVYMLADVAFRTVIGRAPSIVERIAWTAMLVIGGAIVVGIFHK